MVGPDDYKNKKKITVKDTAFRMASKFGVYVHDIDISVNMIRIAKTRLEEGDL